MSRLGYPAHVVDAALWLPRFEATDVGVSRALAALGTTPARVADTLRAGGHRGMRGCEGRCPVSTYLKSALPAAVTVCVDTDAVVVLDHWGNRVADVPLPEPVDLFVADFDRGAAFTDLDETEPDPAADDEARGGVR